MALINATPKVRPRPVPEELARAVNMLADGRSHAVGIVTLDVGTSTLVENEAVSGASVVTLSPVTSNAAGLSWWIDAQADGAFTIMHPSGPSGRQVRYAWIG